MSSNTLSIVSLLGLHSSSIYYPVFQTASRNYLGSWGDADYIYRNIRKDIIWPKFQALMRGPATTDTIEQAQTILEELERIDDKLFALASDLMNNWHTPCTVGPIVAHNAPPRKKQKRSQKPQAKTKSAFQALASLQEEDE